MTVSGDSFELKVFHAGRISAANALNEVKMITVSAIKRAFLITIKGTVVLFLLFSSPADSIRIKQNVSSFSVPFILCALPAFRDFLIDPAAL